MWKESDGIFTGNPTKLQKARLVNHVTPREAAELTYFGNEVMKVKHKICRGVVFCLFLIAIVSFLLGPPPIYNGMCN